MSKIDDLKRELAEIEAKEKEDQEIRDLQKKINAKKFSKTSTGKVFNKIADVGDGLGKVILGTKNNKKQQKSPAKKQKVPTISEIMKQLPQ